ncbi:MAG: sigma-70 family RNA polymerase sigma factor [Bacteroidales bacterium]|nr:sigma-70 family RNA polymerase sigma factor [Bacteroidales bacterium]
MKKDKYIPAIKENQKLIFKICYAYCSNPENRKDLQQEILLQLWNSFAKFDGRVKISTWIYILTFIKKLHTSKCNCEKSLHIFSIKNILIPLLMY